MVKRNDRAAKAVQGLHPGFTKIKKRQHIRINIRQDSAPHFEGGQPTVAEKIEERKPPRPPNHTGEKSCRRLIHINANT